MRDAKRSGIDKSSAFLCVETATFPSSIIFQLTHSDILCFSAYLSFQLLSGHKRSEKEVLWFPFADRHSAVLFQGSAMIYRGDQETSDMHDILKKAGSNYFVFLNLSSSLSTSRCHNFHGWSDYWRLGFSAYGEKTTSRCSHTSFREFAV